MWRAEHDSRLVLFLTREYPVWLFMMDYAADCYGRVYCSAIKLVRISTFTAELGAKKKVNEKSSLCQIDGCRDKDKEGRGGGQV